MLSRDQFLSLAKADLEREEVEVPALGGTVFVRAMTAGEKDAFEQANARAKGRDVRARLAACCTCDAAGHLLFGPADVAALTRLPGHALDAIGQAAMRLNRLGGDAVRELEKNSDAGPPDGSSSGSP
jgi:hypothetical protein